MKLFKFKSTNVLIHVGMIGDGKMGNEMGRSKR